MGRVLVLAALTACYSPSRSPGSPCDPGPCPVGLVCSPATHTCEPTATMPDASRDGHADAPPGAWLTGYAHRKPITITSPLVLQDFPLSVVEASDADLAGSDGKDVVFTADDAITVLPSELVTIQADGGIDAWCETTLHGGSNTIYMYFGGPAATRTSPWSTGYAGVWHMTGSGATERDSAGGHDVSASGVTTTPTSATGIVGLAREYDGIDDAMQAPDPADGSLDFGTTGFSYSVWVFVTSSVGTFDMALHKGGSSAPLPGYDLELGTASWTGNLSDTTAVTNLDFGTESTMLGKWVQLTAVVDRTAKVYRAYVDGVQVSSSSITGVGSLSNDSVLSLGHPSYPFHGKLDEVRIYTRALPATWIAAEYTNLTSRAQFVSIGPEQTK